MTANGQINTPLPAGFADISRSVIATMSGRYSTISQEQDDGTTTIENISFNESQKAAVDHILRHVIKHRGAFLTCFADNKPILDNDLETTVDVCAMNTKALDRKMIRHVLTSAPMSFQRYQYCPGFPRFLTVDGATTYNTWHKTPRLHLDGSRYQRWLTSQQIAKAELNQLVAEDFSPKEALSVRGGPRF